MFVLSACAPRAPRPVSVNVDDRAMVILEPYDVAAYTQQAARVLSEAFPEAATFPIARFVGAFDQSLNSPAVLVVPHADRLPAELWTPLQEFLRRGGAALFWGRDPFQRRVWSSPAGLQAERDLIHELAGAAEDIPQMEPMRLWRHVNDSGHLKGAMRVAKHPDLPWSAVQVEVDGLREWDGLQSETLASGVAAMERGALMLFARGDADTTGLTVQCEDRDGARWYLTLPVSEQWQPFLLRDEDFRLDPEDAMRGGVPTKLTFVHARRFTIGLDMHRMPQSPGRHVFGVSDWKRARDPRPPELASGWPDIPPLAPPHRRYDTLATSVRITATGNTIPAWGARVQSPFPLPAGGGGANGASFRWIALAEAIGDKPPTVGWPASVFLEAEGGRDVRWGWVATETADEQRAVSVELLRACAARLQSRPFLYRAGCDRFSMDAGDALAVAASCSLGHVTGAAARVEAELLSADGAILRRAVTAQAGNGPSADFQISLGAAPEPRGESETFVVRVSLTDPAGRDLLDKIEQTIKVFRPRRAGEREQRLAASGSMFAVAGRPVFLFGMEYEPIASEDAAGSWLDAARFDTAVLARDMDRLRDAGINTLAIAYSDERQAPQLRYALSEAAARRMWVLLTLPKADGVHMDATRIRSMLEAARVPDTPRVFAVDIPCAPDLSRRADRLKLDTPWRNWLVEQFGSIERAEDVMGVALWREGGVVTHPPDEDLAVDGPRRAAVEVYRRFLDDLISRRCGEIRQALDDVAPGLLFTSSGSSLWSGRARLAAEPASGAALQDFITVSGEGLAGDREAFLAAAFLPVYARGAAGGKPVFWTGVGASVGPLPREPDLARQARVYEEHFNLARLARAAGCCVRQYAGGWRPRQNADLGVVDPDGGWRPAEAAVRAFSRQLRTTPMIAPSWRGRTYDRAADARGAAGLLATWAEIYAEEARAARVEEIRPVAFFRETAELDLFAAGNLKYADPAPLASINAQWGPLRIHGERAGRTGDGVIGAKAGDEIDLNLINTGAATWSAGVEGREKTVWVRVVSPDRPDVFLPVSRTPFGGCARLRWTVPSEGIHHLRPWLRDAGGFGEGLRVLAR
jgi:hypothetical protein